MNAVVLIVVFGVLTSFFLFSLISYIRGFKLFAPWVPSSAKTVRKALDFLSLAPGSSFVDLGCGDGRIVFLANRDFKLQAEGFEIALLPYLVAKLRQLFPQNRNTRIHFKNFFKQSLSRYDCIYIYGLPENIRERLLPKLESEAKNGAYIISYNFSLPGKTPIKEFRDRWRTVLIYKLDK